MKRKLGTVLMCCGALLLLCSAGLVFYNHSQDEAAGQASAAILPLVEQEILHREQKPAPQTSEQPRPMEMPVARVEGKDYIGLLTFPNVKRQLPVLADWSYPGLKKAPCRFSGSTFTDDLVILGHNNRKHFGPVARMKPGDPVIFTNADGLSQSYTVTQVEVLMTHEVERLEDGSADLTLVTCTFSGRQRMAIRCDRVFPEG